MSTFMAKKGSIERKWYILDAAGKPLGKTAATAAVLLRGKHKPEYTPMLTAAISWSLSTLKRPFSLAKRVSRSFTAPTPAMWAG